MLRWVIPGKLLQVGKTWKTVYIIHVGEKPGKLNIWTLQLEGWVGGFYF